MTNYYCLVSGLPDLSLDDGKLNYTISNFKSEIYPELSLSDQKIIDIFYLKFDNQNLLKLLKDKDAEINLDGNYSQEELISIIESVKSGDLIDKRFPSYLYDFIKQYLNESSDFKVLPEDLLSGMYYSYAMSCKNKFISSWFEFNLNINNIFTALMARKYKMDVAEHIIGDTDVCEKIRTSNARDFGLNDILEYFESIVRLSEIEDLIEREKKLDLLRWEWMENAVFFNYFTIERLFVFLIKIEMISRWLSLDKETGKEKLREIINTLKEEISIPQELK